MNFKIFFYRGNFWVNRLIAFAIRIKTGKYPKFTHCGLVIDDKIMVDTDIKKKYNARNWTGMSEDFEYIEISVDLLTYRRLLTYIYGHTGTGYDIWECLRWFFGIGKDDKKRLNCVEAVTDALNCAGITKISEDLPLSVDDLYALIDYQTRRGRI